MAKPFGGLIKPQLKQLKLQDLQSFKFVESRLNGGMFTTADPADIDNSQLQRAKNARVRYDKTSRRPGTTLFYINEKGVLTPKPDSDSVLKTSVFKTQVGASYTFRHTATKVYVLGVNVWTPLTGTLVGTNTDGIRATSVLDNYIFANNGANNIQKIDPVTNTVADLGNAPNYRYVTGFFNRVVGAARRDANEIEVGWSADGLVDQWDFNVDPTAGSSPIVISTSNESDFITGIFGFDSVMILMRQQSIYLATKQPIPTNPFYFDAAPGTAKLGCDSPRSIAVTGGGLTYFDRRTQTVWFFQPGAAPEPIGRPIENTIVKGIDDPETIFASYNSITNEYTLCIPQASSDIVKAYTFNFRTKAWTYDEIYAITSADDINLPDSAVITFDDLVGTFDSLVGTFDELSPSASIQPARVYGRNDGEILREDDQSLIDPPHADNIPDMSTFPTELVLKSFSLPELDMYFAEVVIEYISLDGGSFTLDYSKELGDDLDNAALWKTAKTVTPKKLGVPQLLRFTRQIKAKRLTWRLKATAARFEILGYEIHAYPSGKSKQE